MMSVYKSPTISPYPNTENNLCICEPVYDYLVGRKIVSFVSLEDD